MSAPDHFPELAATLQSIRERVRQRVERSTSSVPDLHLPPRESVDRPPAAPQWLANAIGQVNPRSGGLGNELVQTLKRTQARLSDWQLRPQREFNVAVVEALQKIAAILEAMDRNSIAVRQVLDQYGREVKPAMEKHDRELYREIDALCEQITQQRWSYEGALMRQTQALSVAEEELRQLRQRVANQAKVQAMQPQGIPVGAPPTNGRSSTPIEIDYLSLEHDFRGSEQEINRRQRFYLPFFQGRKNVLDIACGRGEFLELMREAGVPAKGVDLDADMVGRCLEKGLDVQQADVFAYLAQVPDGALDGIFSAQFVEHLEAGDYLRLITQCAGKLEPGGILAIETQNPECLAIFSQSFYIDPTHVRPIPPAQLRYAFANAGLAKVATYPLSPAAAVLPVLPKLPAGAADPDALRAFNVAVEKFNDTFFGGMDYAVIGYRPATGRDA